MTEFLKGRVLKKIPKPPAGYVLFKPKNIKKGEPPSQYSAMLCPYCKKAEGWCGGGEKEIFTDKNAQALLEKGEETLNSYEVLCQEFEGVMLKCHWSRFGIEKCMNCDGLIWHDWDSGMKDGKYFDYNHYWKPKGSTTLGDFI